VRGSVLLLSLFLCSLLSVLVLGAAGSLMLAEKTEASLAESTQLIYLAEAGLAHARSYCRSVSAWPPAAGEVPVGEELVGDAAGEEAPLDRWIPWGPGKYKLQAAVLSENPSPTPGFGELGILVQATGAMGDHRKKKLQALLEEPPSCRIIAWWEPD